MTDPTAIPDRPVATGITHVSDARGELLAVELSELAFPPARVFVARGAEGGSWRGDHTIPCTQLMVLIGGRAEVRIGSDRESLAEPVTLADPGDSVSLPAGQYISYRLVDDESAVLVLADEPYRGGAA